MTDINHNSLENSRKSFCLSDAPRIINMELDKVYINKYAPCSAEQVSFDNFVVLERTQSSYAQAERKKLW